MLNIGPILIIFTSLCWATDSLFRIGVLKVIDPLVLVFLEHSVLVVLTSWILYKERHQFKNLDRFGWVSAFVVGVGGSALALFLFTLSFKYMNPTVSILLQKLHPIFAIGSAAILLGEKIKRGTLFWGAIALLAGILLGFEELSHLNKTMEEFNFFGESIDPSLGFIGIFLSLCAALIWGVSTTCSRHLAVNTGYLFPLSLRFSLAFVFLGIFVFTIHGPEFVGLQIKGLLAGPGLYNLLALAVISGLLGMIAYYYGLQTTKAQVATFLESLWPAFAVFINWFAYDLTLHWHQIVAGIILIAAIAKLQSKAR